MQILNAKDYNNRQELEDKVSSLMGLTAEVKADYLIRGTHEELYKLHLGQGKIFWGIKVEETDYKQPKKLEPVNRGKIYKSKLETIDIEKFEEEPSVKKKFGSKKLGAKKFGSKKKGRRK